MFCRNVGKTERIIRVLVGLALIALVQEKVFAYAHVKLEPEVQILGE